MVDEIVINETIDKKINNVFASLQALETFSDDIFKKQSKIDKSLSECYHKIEGTKITHVSQSHALIKELKQILDDRRDIKKDVTMLIPLVQASKQFKHSFSQKRQSAIQKHKIVLQKLAKHNK